MATPLIEQILGEKLLYLLVGAGLALAGALIQDYLKSNKSRIQNFKNLLAELEDNQLLSKQFQLAGGPAKVRFTMGMWDIAKGELNTLPTDLQVSLRTVYSEMAKFNCIVDYDLGMVSGGNVGSGRFDQSLTVHKNRIDEILPQAIVSLKTHSGPWWQKLRYR